MTALSNSTSPAPESQSDVFRHPLEYIFADHDRQRIICAVLERIADDLHASDARRNAAHVLNHLENELPQHIADEERDLFPLLRQRCFEDDRIEALLALLQDEHEEDDAHCAALMAPLRAMAAGQPIADESEFAAHARDFARFQRRHLGWENGTILPLAERRLTDKDFIVLGTNMARRRGINPPQ